MATGADRGKVWGMPDKPLPSLSPEELDERVDAIIEQSPSLSVTLDGKLLSPAASRKYAHRPGIREALKAEVLRYLREDTVRPNWFFREDELTTLEDLNYELPFHD